ncbi:hypothetical protein [Niallia circulans]|uniref:hypothetical protein n=1 Tax=Niallia circulans TaxID=1397 RepID=UPI0003192C72|nr:hypothetical protein [Niallia circulans]
MNKKNFLLLFLCYILIIPVPLVKGAEENIYSPISFDIQLLSWNVINEMIPKYSKFTILDIETGNQFKVQRRAGSQHADVQPLTVKDTKIMKEIYEGKWSWRRRAILIMVNDQWFAASMHGMPHGAGALANNFPGHFCVHFLGSTTHKTEKMDFSHKLMVYKAAGQLRQYLEQMNPNDAVKAFIAGIKEKDATILSYITTKQDWSSELALIENIKINRLNEVKPKVYEQALQVTLAIECNVYMKNARTRNIKKDLVLVRTSPLEGWKVKVEDSSI